MNTAGMIQWPQRLMVSVTRRWETSHDPTVHQSGTQTANTVIVTAVAAGSRVCSRPSWSGWRPLGGGTHAGTLRAGVRGVERRSG